MNPPDNAVSRRGFVRATTALAVAALAGRPPGPAAAAVVTNRSSSSSAYTISIARPPST